MKKTLWALLASAWVLSLPAKSLLEIQGDYLLYSYDYNHIFGQGRVLLRSTAWTIRAGTVEVDVSGHSGLAARDCLVEAGGREYNADLLEIDLDTLSLKLTTFDESVRSWTLPGEGAGGRGAAAGKFVSRDPESLKRSLVYFLNGRIVISTLYRVYGYQTTVFIEGVQSLSFKKFNLDRGGDTSQLRGVWIDRIWYYASQGLVVNSHFLLEKPLARGAAKSSNVLDVKYDLFKQIDYGPALRVNLTSQNSVNLARNHVAGLRFGYLTDNLLQTQLSFTSQWTPQWSSELALEYSRTASRREELWLRLLSSLQQKVLGSLSLELGYEREGQHRAAFSLNNQALKNIQLSLQHSFSRLLFSEGTFSRQSNSLFSLGYTNRLFQMSADYSFHRDLLQDQSQGTPRFTLSATPFRLYGGLLQMNFASSFMINQLTLAGQRNEQSRANLSLGLQTEAVRLGKGPVLTFSLSGEQLLDPDRSNRVTSLGGVLRCSQSLGGLADFELLYNYNTRRQTEAWFLQGSTSQDWSGVLRLKEGVRRVQGWLSVSYDSKAGQFTNGYLDCSVSLFKNWQLQTQMNYDFVFRNFNYDVFLARHAGRIMVRASYRSLSRRFLIEILPR